MHELSAGVLDFGERTFIMETGERGSLLFSKAVLNHTAGWTQLISGARMGGNPAALQNVSSPLHSNALSGGFQFVEWKFNNRVTVKVQVNPVYDDTVRNKILHPLGKSHTAKLAA